MTKIYLALDTETTGFKRKGSLIQEGQARVCQLGIVLADAQGRTFARFSSLVKPDGWQISEGASRINGLTNEMCEEKGMSHLDVYKTYKHFVSMADVIIAHNSNFDMGMMQIESAYYHRMPSGEMPPPEDMKPWYCTATNNTSIMKLPPTKKMRKAGRNHYKMPNLEEALQFFCGESVGDNAHDALVDAEACLKIFFASRKYKESEVA